MDYDGIKVSWWLMNKINIAWYVSQYISGDWDEEVGCKS